MSQVQFQPAMSSLPPVNVQEMEENRRARELEQIPEIQDVLRQIPNPAPNLANTIFEMFCDAAIIGLKISRNERNQTDVTKRNYRRDSGLVVDNMRSGGNADLVVAIATSIGHFGAFMGSGDGDKEYLRKVADLIPQFARPLTGSYQTGLEEARGRKELYQTDLTNSSQAASQFQQAVMDIAKNMVEQSFRTQIEAARAMS